MREGRFSSGFRWFVGACSLVACARGVELGLIDDDAGATGASGAGGQAGASSTMTSGPSETVGGAAGTGPTGGNAGVAGSDAAGGASAGGGAGAGVAGAGGASGGSAGTSAGGGAGGRGGGGRDGGGGVRPDASAGTAGASGASGAAGGMADAPSEPPPICATCALRLQYQCFQDGLMVQQLEFGVNIVNVTDAPIAMSTITARYWYTEDATGTQQPRCDSAGVCSTASLGVHAVTPPRPTADAYLEIGFTGPAMLAPHAETGEIRITLLKTGASAYTQSNDHSFKSTGASYLDAPNLTGYVGGRLAWGMEPP